MTSDTKIVEERARKGERVSARKCVQVRECVGASVSERKRERGIEETKKSRKK